MGKGRQVSERVTGELREYVGKSKGAFTDHMLAIADRIDAEHERGMADAYLSGTPTDEKLAELGWVRLPVDADGVPIRVGDVMESKGSDFLFDEASFEVRAMRCDECGWEVYDRLGDRYAPSLLRHHHAPTVEDVLREFGDWYAHTKGGRDEDGIVAEYAAKLRLAGGE